MSITQDPLVEDEARKLTADAYPRAEELPGVPGSFRRKWVLRLSTRLPEGGSLENFVRSFEQNARREIVNALRLPGDLAQPFSSVVALRLSDHHLILQIDCPTTAAEMGDAAAIATWSVLRAADKLWQLDDLQGIPKRYWFAMK